MSATPASQRIWDLPTRLFHWLLVVALLASFVSGEVGGAWIDWHLRSGLLVVALIGFRLAWGIVGSATARFAQFLRGPAAIRAHWRGQWRGVGHSPIGGIAVVVLMLAVIAQLLTGLYANDDISFDAPLSVLVDKNTSDALRLWHGRLFYLLAVLTAMHVVAIVYYLRVKRDDLITPMLTGYKRLDPERSAALPQPLTTPRYVAALLLSLLAAVVITWIASGGLLNPAPASAPMIESATPKPAW